MSNKTILSLAVAASLGLPTLAVASPDIAGGFWASWRYNTTDDSDTAETDKDTYGDIGREALILYVDGGDGPWTYSAETRFGPGSFTDVNNNSTGDNFAIHKAWLGYTINDSWDVKIGKSQVPFGWKTVNFWPGDMFQAGYGDQMDIGAKVTGSFGDFGTSIAYFHQDDWGETSTDTVDDNAHWGSSTTWRKSQTVVGDFNYTLATGDMSHKFGVSAQAGVLQDLTDADPATGGNVDYDHGSHNAGVLYYEGMMGPFTAKAEYIMVNRDIPDQNTDVENSRIALEGQYAFGNWTAYLDVTTASTDTDGNTSDDITAYSPGVKYNYGPGWFYVEYLDQNGYIGRDGDVVNQDSSDDFSSLYVTMDYYF